MQHTLHNTPYSDKIPTRSTRCSRDCKLPKHSTELTETCLDLWESSSFLSAKCRSHKLCFTDSLCVYFEAVEGTRSSLIVHVTLFIITEWLDWLSWWSSTALHTKTLFVPMEFDYDKIRLIFPNVKILICQNPKPCADNEVSRWQVQTVISRIWEAFNWLQLSLHTKRSFSLKRATYFWEHRAREGSLPPYIAAPREDDTNFIQFPQLPHF